MAPLPLRKLSRGVRRLGRFVHQRGASLIADRWMPYSRLFLVADAPHWTISEDLRELRAIVRRLGIAVADAAWLPAAREQAVFFGSHLMLLGAPWVERPHRLGTAYFHGRPGSGLPEFDIAWTNLCRHHERLHRVQVTHTEMRNLVLSSGIAPEKVFLIPLGVNLDFFQLQTAETRRRVRAAHNIPESAVVVGSFQKDGIGWGEGLEPKLIKGPDIFLRTIALLRERIPGLLVLLTGPARGYVKRGLAELGVPFRHIYVRQQAEVAPLYQALDLYLITSRQEGGPKALLEAMASGVPVVSTRVGQAMDLVRHGQNGWLVEVEDVEGLAYWAERALADQTTTAAVVRSARETAVANAYTAQTHLWERFMRGFVSW